MHILTHRIYPRVPLCCPHCSNVYSHVPHLKLNYNPYYKYENTNRWNKEPGAARDVSSRNTPHLADADYIQTYTIGNIGTDNPMHYCTSLAPDGPNFPILQYPSSHALWQKPHNLSYPLKVGMSPSLRPHVTIDLSTTVGDASPLLPPCSHCYAYLSKMAPPLTTPRLLAYMHREADYPRQLPPCNSD
jgi:hypothetical protein